MVWLIVGVLGLLLILAQAVGIGSWGFIASFGWLGLFLVILVGLVRPGSTWWNK